jgi:hypothetical protein
MKTSNFDKRIFKPRPSTGWLWVALCALIPLGGAVTLILQFGYSSAVLPIIGIASVIGIGFLVIAVFFPGMKYEIDGSSLTLTYGPLLRYTIDIKQIKSIRRSDMGLSFISSFRFPGLALFSVPYPEIGLVKMCATAASNGILIIETNSGKFGMTPADESSFVAELRRRMEQ